LNFSVVSQRRLGRSQIVDHGTRNGGWPRSRSNRFVKLSRLFPPKVKLLPSKRDDCEIYFNDLWS